MLEAKLASRKSDQQTSVVHLTHGTSCGGQELLVIGGPCTVESSEQLETVASQLAGTTIHALRGGAYKPRTSPYSFQGMGSEGLKLLEATGKKHQLPIVTEVMSCEQIPEVVAHADVLQIGSRNMQNYELLKAVGQLQKPILLKRGLSATIEEFLLAAEYILSQGNPNVILCERGIRSFDSYTRNVLDLGAVVALKQLTHLPVVVDPSHAAGKRELIADLSRAAVACGADGLIIECHPQPELSVSDARQALSLNDMEALVESLVPVAKAVGRTITTRRRSHLSLVRNSGLEQTQQIDDENNLSHNVDPATALRKLRRLRQQIDELDATMSLAMNERLLLAGQLSNIKSQLQMPIHDVERERQVLKNVSESGADPAVCQAIKSIWEMVMAESRTLQHTEQPAISRVSLP